MPLSEVPQILEPFGEEPRLNYQATQAWPLRGNQMSQEEVLKWQVLWERDLEERWQAQELLKSPAIPETMRRHAQERLERPALAPPPSMAWAIRPRVSH